MSRPQPYTGVAILAPVTVPYARFSDHSAAWFIGNALATMLRQTGIDKKEVDGLSISSFTLGSDSAVSLTEHFGLVPRWLEQIPFGGSSGVVSLRRAARAIQNGDADMIACIGGDTSQTQSFKETVANFSTFSTDAVYPYGSPGPNGPFSLITQRYMDTYGATREDFGRIAVSQRYNANHNPNALLGHKTLTMEQYLQARPIAGPVHLFDCVMPCAGADGFLVTSVARAEALGLPYATLLAADERHNAFHQDPVQLRGGWSLFRDDLYNLAGVGPQDIDCLQTYDDYPVICMLQMEGLGFCEQGSAPEFVRNNSLSFDGGGLPHNTNGGQLSVGQAGCGYLGVVETIKQVLNCAGDHQVPSARIGMVSGYGMVNYDRGLCSAAAIVRGEKQGGLA
ncbi:thiolase family protein [Pseudomaricurvus alkylphenolicus]|jgi:acetyl-CoA acetyltransferase|uniref:thiolase family protein n=1 Tax=Pseudomaricurvus alkylphenolicus TaxID=1306991 RepID=UPI0014232976|nr:thiolase family protein [Pseudomaricurvus alkylphenolicus]NIB40443.1 thiolase family protein [Pseudomaricurvus alkylphenolicus]